MKLSHRHMLDHYRDHADNLEAHHETDEIH